MKDIYLLTKTCIINIYYNKNNKTAMNFHNSFGQYPRMNALHEI
jgi:hypothetical protein